MSYPDVIRHFIPLTQQVNVGYLAPTLPYRPFIQTFAISTACRCYRKHMLNRPVCSNCASSSTWLMASHWGITLTSVLDILVEIVTEIFLWTHPCEQENPADVISFCCVSLCWQREVYAIPIMWHHVVRLPRQASSSQALTHIQHMIDCPLHLSLQVVSHDSQINSFLPLLEKFAHRWQHIEIVGKQFELVRMVLAPTIHGELPILQSLVVHKEPFTMNSPGFRPLLMTQALP